MRGTALALVMVLAAAPGAGLAQTIGYTDVGLNDSGGTTKDVDYSGISLNEVGPGQQISVPEVLGSGIGDGQQMATVVGGSAVEPIQSEQVGSYLRLDQTVQGLADDTTTGDMSQGYRTGQTPIDRASRYYGNTVSGDDLTSDNYTDDQYNTDRGKVAQVARRLGVFDRNHSDPRTLVIKPYIEASQVLDSYYAPTASQVTYTDLVAGAEVTVNRRNNQGVISARVDQRLGWGTSTNSTDFTGLANLSTAIIPDVLRIDYGGYANTTYISPLGATLGNANNVGNRERVLAGYVGPTLTSHIGDIGINGHYRVGYASIGQNGYDATNTLQNGIDVFGHSVMQDARLAAGVRPGQVWSIGLSAIGGYYSEHISNLSQQVESSYARGEVILPITDDLALVGGAGVEKIKVTSLNAVIDSNGNPEVDRNGRFIANTAGPRYVAMNVDDAIWDVGVEWRPSRRTNFEAHIGHRYGELSGYGTLTYMPTPESNMSLVVYNNLGGFGGDLNNTLSNLSSQFQTVRDGITGNISSCLSTAQVGSCLGGILGSANSAFALSHGATFGYDHTFGRFDAGFGFGYDVHRYIAALNTVEGAINGKADTYYWIDTFVGVRINEKSQFQTTVNLYKYHSGLVLNSDVTSMRLVSIYQYFPTSKISVIGSLAINGSLDQNQPDMWSSTLAAGVRYTF